MDIVEQMRSFESDHEPDGWPAVTMGQISALCDEIERLHSIIDAQQSPRITDQDARIIVESAIHHYIFSDKGANIDNWFEDEGRDLLAKLNEAKHD